jgi:hypothetical protein
VRYAGGTRRSRRRQVPEDRMPRRGRGGPPRTARGACHHRALYGRDAGRARLLPPARGGALLRAVHLLLSVRLVPGPQREPGEPPDRPTPPASTAHAGARRQPEPGRTLPVHRVGAALQPARRPVRRLHQPHRCQRERLRGGGADQQGDRVRDGVGLRRPLRAAALAAVEPLAPRPRGGLRLLRADGTVLAGASDNIGLGFWTQ